VRATVTVSDGQAALRLATTQPRPLEVRLNGRRIDPRVPGASVRYDKGTNQTRITFAMFSGDQTVEWTER
jgi:hypothetical protein